MYRANLFISEYSLTSIDALIDCQLTMQSSAVDSVTHRPSHPHPPKQMHDLSFIWLNSTIIWPIFVVVRAVTRSIRCSVTVDCMCLCM